MNESDKIMLQLAQDVAYIKGTLMGDISSLKDRVNKVESTLTWGSRLMIGGIISAMMAFLFSISK